MPTGSDEIPRLVLGDGTHDPSHPAAARLRAGESPATVLHDELRHLTRQANEQGHLPLADCVEILKAADQVGAAHAARDGTPHEPLLPENFHRLTPEEQAALVRTQILPDPQAPAASQKLRDIASRVGGQAAGKFTTFVSAARERFRRSMENARNGGKRLCGKRRMHSFPPHPWARRTLNSPEVPQPEKILARRRRMRKTPPISQLRNPMQTRETSRLLLPR